MEEQQRIQHLLSKMKEQNGHLMALRQQQQDAQYLFALAQYQHQEFTESLFNHQQVDYWGILAQQQRREYINALMQQQQCRESLYASSLTNPQEQQTFMNATQQQQLAAPSVEYSQDPFQLLGEDIHRHILSFLTCLRLGQAMPFKTAAALYRDAHGGSIDEPFHYFRSKLSGEEQAMWGAFAKQDYQHYQKEDAAFTRPSQLLEVCTNLSLVSKFWYLVMGTLMNSKAPVGILSPQDLFRLKSRARSLAVASISENFLHDCTEKWHYFHKSWSPYVNQEHPLDAVMNHFGGPKDFARLATDEYIKFLVVKSVETIASHNKMQLSSNAWTEPCQPTLLVDLFWHAHMLSPQKYVSDCNALLGNLLPSGMDCIIDHTAGYVSRNAIVGSDYASKVDLLFSFEKQFPKEDYFGGRLGEDGDASVLFSNDFDLERVANEIWDDMQGYNDCG